MAKKQEELQFSGFLDIFKQSFKVIFSHPKIFAQIAVFFVFPLSCISLAVYIESTSSMPTNTFYANLIPGGSLPDYNQDPPVPPPKQDYTKLVVLVIFSLLLSLVLNFIPVSTTVYTVACIQNGKEITLSKAIRVIPKVWKRVPMTYLSQYIAIFAVYFIFIIVIMVIMVLLSMSSSRSPESTLAKMVGLLIGMIVVVLLFILAVVYISIIWLLADVVSVLEEICGMKALKKSKSLIKGKMGTTIATYLVMLLFTLPSMFLYLKLKSNDVSIGVKIGCGILVLVLTSLVSVLSIVVKTVLYFVCKSYHHEPIDNLHLVDYVEISHMDRV